MTRTERLARALIERHWTISTVESCTAGGLAYRITEVPGASAYFLGGIVAYDNRVKIGWIGVPERLIAQHGAVSAEVARAMSEGGRARFESDLCVAITGIAGPAGGTPDRPVGTVFLSVSGRSRTRTERHQFSGSRSRIRQGAIDLALDMALGLASEG